MEIFRALGALVEPPSPALAPIADALDLGPLPEASAHTDLFDFQLYPYASVYLNEDGMLGSAARDRIADFLRVLGAAAPPEPDHLAFLLACYASLAEAESKADNESSRIRAQHARSAFLHEHLLSWLPFFLGTLRRITAADAFYRAWGQVLSTALDNARNDAEPPASLALHLRRAPAMADPRTEGTDAFLASLLAPAVSGMILVRDDLARGAAELDLGMRKGERRFVMRALLGQEPGRVLEWLAGEARRQGRAHPDQGAATAHWRARCRATADLLTDLAGQAIDTTLRR